MELSKAVRLLAALAQETRLQAFRLLVEAGPGGVSAGRLSAALGVPQNTMSFHLKELAHAGVVTARRDGRSVIYAADFERVRDLVAFLVRDCCSREVASIRDDRRRKCAIIELADCGAPRASAGHT